MARAHSRSVIDAMIAALDGIHTDNGDSFTPTIVQRWDADRSIEGTLPAIGVRRLSNPRDRDQGSGWLNTLSVEIQVGLYTGEEVENAGDEVIEEAEEDVWRALRAMDWDNLRAEFRGFQATTLRDIDEDHPVEGFRAVVTVEWKIAYDDPDVVIDQ